MTTQYVEIRNGPSKFDLMLALFDRVPSVRLVRFVVETPNTKKRKKTNVEVVIVGVESWGLCGSDNDNYWRITAWDEVDGRLGLFRADYNTRTRKGLIFEMKMMDMKMMD